MYIYIYNLIPRSCRFVSVLASYTLFPKPVNTQHVCGILLFFAGMLLSWSQQTRTNNTHNNTHTRPPKPKRAAHKHCGGGADMQDMQDMRELLAQDDVSADTSGGGMQYLYVCICEYLYVCICDNNIYDISACASEVCNINMYVCNIYMPAHRRHLNRHLRHLNCFNRHRRRGP